jgi:hypothetical protein
VTREPYETERLLLRLAGLVRRGEVLRAQGAPEEELEANRLEAERLRWRLASAVRRRALTDDRPRVA